MIGSGPGFEGGFAVVEKDVLVLSNPSRLNTVLLLTAALVIVAVVGALVAGNQMEPRFARVQQGQRQRQLRQGEANLRAMAGAVARYNLCEVWSAVPSGAEGYVGVFKFLREPVRRGPWRKRSRKASPV